MDEQFYIYDPNGIWLNTIMSTEAFAKQYCEENGWTFKPVIPKPPVPGSIEELLEAFDILTGGRDDELDQIISNYSETATDQ